MLCSILAHEIPPCATRRNEQSKPPSQQPRWNVGNLWHSFIAKGGKFLPFGLCACVTNTISCWNFSHCLDNHGVYQAPKWGLWPLVGHGCSHHPGHPYHGHLIHPEEYDVSWTAAQSSSFCTPTSTPCIFHCCISIARTMFNLVLLNERDPHQHEQESRLSDRAVLFAGVLWHLIRALLCLHWKENKFCFCVQRFLPDL